jgi:uncharacterized protein involved in exopolysaccharide biosynthesis
MTEARYEDEINLLDYWRILVKRKRLILGCVGGAAIAAIIISLLLPKIYAATTTLMPPRPDTSIIGMMGAEQQIGASAMSGFFGGGSPSDLWVAILNSRSIQDVIIKRFDLMRLFETENMDDTRKALAGVVMISKSKKDDTISITVEDESPRQAAIMANAIVEELDKVNKRVVMTAGGRMRTFIERRLKEEKEALALAEEAVRRFQEMNGAVQLDEQSRAVIGAMGEMRGTLMAREVELQSLLSYASPNNPQVELLRVQVAELKANLKTLEEGERGQAVSSNSIFIPSARLPDLALQYARLLRDAKARDTVYVLLTQQYEMARIQEAKDTPTVQVLDVAVAPDRRSRPKRTFIVLLSTFMAGFFSLFLAFFLEYVEKARKLPETQTEHV